MFKMGKRAQSTAEYAILIAIVVGAVVAMQVYIRRGIQGRIKEVVDYTGNDLPDTKLGTFQFQPKNSQYEPYYNQSTSTTTQSASESESIKTGGAVERGSSTSSDVNRTQTQGW